MNRCLNCGVWLEVKTCPLCHQKIAEPTVVQEINRYPDYDGVGPKKTSLFARLVIVISIAIVSASLLINVFVTPHFFWVLYVMATVLYLSISINHTIMSSAHPGGKIVNQMICLSGLLVIVDALSGFKRWSVNFVIPFLIVGTALLITAILLKQRARWRDYVGYIISVIILGFLPVGLYFTGISTVFWPSSIPTLYTLLTLLGLFLFSSKIVKQQLIRRFHL